MALALIVLAIGSVLAGYVGLPPVLGGSRLEHFLEPSFTAGHVATAEANAEPISQEAAVEGEAHESVEVTLMAVSVVVALSGIGIAAFFFLKNRAAADGVAARFAGLRTVLLNKYYVDEIYDASIVQPVRLASEEGLWKIVDVGIIDRAVNGVADLSAGVGEMLRRAQTGSVRAYAASLFAGVVLVLGYYFWR
jgi:NADH-quinone oxidoreductase subunit L